jgi:Ammonia permease
MDSEVAGESIPLLEGGGINPAALLFFQFVFCAVSLAIVWGTTLERIKFGAYIIYAVVFSALIYPVLSHWIFAGGFLQEGFLGLPGMQDFAGSTVVHLIGATGALAALLLLGPRRGKYGPDGKPRAIPGHSMPLVGLGVLILWLGWFGFNPGSTLGAADGRFAEVALVTNLSAAAGVIGATIAIYALGKTIDIGMVGNGAIAGLVGITAPSGYVEFWAAPVIGLIAGVIVVVGVLAIEKKLDDPVGALSAHGLAGIWGTVACGVFTAPRLAELNGVGEAGLWYSGSFAQLGAQVVGVTVAFVVVFVVSFAVFYAIKKTIGLRVSAEQEDAGSRHRRARHVRLPRAVHPAAGDRSGIHRSKRHEGRHRSGWLGHDKPCTRGGARMKKIEAFIRNESFEAVRMDLLDKGFPSLSISRLRARAGRRASRSSTEAPS